MRLGLPRPAVWLPMALMGLLLLGPGSAPVRGQGTPGAEAGPSEPMPPASPPAEPAQEPPAAPQAPMPAQTEPAPPKIEMARPPTPPPGQELPRTPIGREVTQGTRPGDEGLAAAEPGLPMTPDEEDEVPRSMLAPWQSRPTLARVALLNASGKPGLGNQVAVVLLELRRLKLEKEMGMRLEVVNVSTAPESDLAQSKVYYRPGFLRAALMLAEALPGDQAVKPMSPEQETRRGIDVEIWLGKELP